MPRPFDFIELVLKRTPNRCAAVSAVSEVVGAFDRLELANKLSKSHQGHRRCWVDPARLFKNGACRAKGRPEIASTRRTYPPPCPPPQGGRQGDTNHESFFDLQKDERTKRPGINACFFFNRAFPKPFPPPLWGRAGWGVPKNKIAAEKTVSYRQGIGQPDWYGTPVWTPLPSKLLIFFLQPMFLKPALIPTR